MTHQRAEVITRHIKKWDRRLSAKYVGEGLIHILFSDANVNKLVMSLTDNWSANGQPRLWGIEPILMRLRQIDVSGNQSHLEELRKQREREEESRKRDMKNKIEDGAREARPLFAKAFNDINTSTLDKTYDKRKLKGA